jgi:hypothetical protein
LSDSRYSFGQSLPSFRRLLV